MSNIKNLKKVAIIPARAGSKRIKLKNIIDVNGLPLLAYTIKYALSEKNVDRVIVSTDSKIIQKIAKKHGAECPFLRPRSLSESKISDKPVLAHAAKWLEDNENYYPDILIYLRPTVLLRKKGLIGKCINKLISSNCTALRTIREVGHWHPYWMVKLNKKNIIKEFLKDKNVEKYYQSQLLPKIYKHDGYVDIVLRKNLPSQFFAGDNLKDFYGKKIYGFINEDKYFINIDNYNELELARHIMKMEIINEKK